jgi:hypothetical protein
MPDLTRHGKVLAIRTPAQRSSGVRHAGVLPEVKNHMLLTGFPQLICTFVLPTILKNEHGVGRVREALGHLVDCLS